MDGSTESLVNTLFLKKDVGKTRQSYCFNCDRLFLPTRKMTVFFRRRIVRRICLITFIAALTVFCLIFIGVPIIFRYSYNMQRSLLFLNFVNMPNVNYNKPSNLGLVGARSVHINTKDGVKLGIWHTLPVKYQLEAVGRTWLSGSDQQQALDAQYDAWMQHGVTVIYCHGNAGSRASDHRVRLYKILNQQNYHVVTFDYRGYADSSSVATDEQGVVNDTKAVISWVRERVSSGHIVVWAHSLGTAIASHALAELEAEKMKVAGIILEAPFNNLSDEIREYPISQMFRFLPWFDFFFVDPVFENNLRFQSDVNLRNVSTPILFLHAEDDKVVPYRLGQKLYKAVKDSRNDDKSVDFIPFDSKLGHGHKFIYRDKRIPAIVRKFVDEVLQKEKNWMQ